MSPPTYDPALSFDDRYPKIPLLYAHSTSIEPLSNLESRLEEETQRQNLPRLFIAREDSNSGLGGGGNKIRKLEYVMHDARARGATVILTTGGQQSNHMRQVAAAAARLNTKCHLIPRNALKHDTADKDVYNGGASVQITDLTQAKRHPVQESVEEVEVAKDRIIGELRAQGEVPYWIPSGASTHPLGGLGYARFAFELHHQLDRLPDTIFLACNSGSTLGGIVAGFKLLEQRNVTKTWTRPRIVGIDTFSGRPGGGLTGHVLEIARNTAELIGVTNPNAAVSDDDFIIDERFTGSAYGQLDETVVEAVKTLASTEGILLDPVYTGKAFAAVLHGLRCNEHAKREENERSNWLFIHTGGVPILGAYPDLR